MESYGYISNSMDSHNSGFGDWFFRQEAFPELPDNTATYRQRFFPHSSQERRFQELVEKKRSQLGTFMESLITLYKLHQADVVGFTSMFMQNTACFAMARKLKKRNPQVLTIMGGANCESPMGEVIVKQIKDIDFVFSGPALKSFPEFLQHYFYGDKTLCDSIRGVFSKRSSPRSGAECVGEELDINTPIELDYDSFIRRLERYFPASGLKAQIPFETSRGCWWGQRAHCTFCGLNGAAMGYRSMAPEAAIQQFKSLFRYSDKTSRLSAVDNILPKNYIQQVLPALETPKSMGIFYEVKADLSEQDISVLAKARVNEIQPGIESLATSTLKLMKKGTTAFQNLGLLQLCVRYGIRPLWNLLVGFPGEDEQTYESYIKNLPLLFHLPPPIGVYPVRFDRFSPYHSKPEAYNLDLQPMDFYSLIYSFSETDFRNFAYYFVDSNVNAQYRTTMLKWLDRMRAQVNEWQSRWSSSSHLRPQLRFAKNSTSVYDSRSGSIVEHPIGEAAGIILSRMARPITVPDLTRQLSAELICDVSKEIEWLEKQGLVFREGDRMLSLVFREKEISAEQPNKEILAHVSGGRSQVAHT
jgi:ribosomal peptide maturation radical SAM protein 1